MGHYKRLLIEEDEQREAMYERDRSYTRWEEEEILQGNCSPEEEAEYERVLRNSRLISNFDAYLDAQLTCDD